MMNTTMIDYSIVIPVFNEAASLEELFLEVSQTMTALQKGFEIVFINDGSYDETAHILSTLASRDSRIKILSLRGNRGKSVAYKLGFEASSGKIIITLDADLQDDPNEIPRLLGPLSEGYDIVIGWKQNRLQNEPIKKFFSWFFNQAIKFLFRINLHDSNSGFRVMKSEVANSLELYGDLYRFIPELAHTKGFRVKEVGIMHRRRKYGHSKFGTSRFWTGLLDILTVRFLSGFIRKPLHFFGTLGMIPFIFGFSLELYVLARKLSGDTFSTHLAALIIGVLSILVGFQFMAIGLIGEMISKHNKDDYSYLKKNDI